MFVWALESTNPHYLRTRIPFKTQITTDRQNRRQALSLNLAILLRLNCQNTHLSPKNHSLNKFIPHSPKEKHLWTSPCIATDLLAWEERWEFHSWQSPGGDGPPRRCLTLMSPRQMLQLLRHQHLTSGTGTQATLYEAWKDKASILQIPQEGTEEDKTLILYAKKCGSLISV